MTNNTFSLFKYMPLDMLEHTFSFNTHSEYEIVAGVSKAFKQAADDPAYWNNMLEEVHRINDDTTGQAKKTFVDYPAKRLDKYLFVVVSKTVYN